ncbi:MAG: glycosyltransferase family 2 protein [Bacteroidota bacterium]
MQKRFLLLIPAFNAESTIQKLIIETKKYFLPENILVVNDGSSDKTFEIANSEKVNLLNHSKNLGKGAALKTGFQFAVENNFDWVLTMDADLQHSPNDVPKFFDEINISNSDIILGNRMNDLKNMPLHRRFSNIVTSFLVRLRTNQNIIDSQCGFRFYKIDVLKYLQNFSDGYEFETEILIWASKNNFKISSVPIETIYNNEKSFMNHLHTTKKFLKSILRKY